MLSSGVAVPSNKYSTNAVGSVPCTETPAQPLLVIRLFSTRLSYESQKLIPPSLNSKTLSVIEIPDDDPDQGTAQSGAGEKVPEISELN